MRVHSFIAAVTLLLTSAMAIADEPRPATVAAASAPVTAFRLPAVDNKPIATAPSQRVFRLPMRFARVEAFYRGLYVSDPNVRFVPGHDEAGRTLTLRSTKPGDAWARAVIHEGVVDTVVEVTPVVHLQAEIVEGRAKPWVTFVFKHSDEVANMANSIDHLPAH